MDIAIADAARRALWRGRGQRLQRQGFDAGIPVLCVGNYHVGGAGKTPTVLALARLLRDLGETPVVLSRGYGGRLRGPVKVDPARHAAADVGDEPLMLARTVPVVVARDRIGGVALARSQGASVILMDDGFQNPAIAKDASLIVIDGDRGLGNGLRVSRRSVARAAAAAACPHRCADRHRRWHRGRRGRRRHRRAGQAGAVGASEAGRGLGGGARAASACWPLPGSAIPRGFSGRCAPAGSRSSRSAPSPIIIRFRKSEIEALIAEAKRDALTLVTTEKDLARLRDGDGLPAWAQRYRAVRGDARIRRRRAIAEVRVGPAVQGAREEISA